MESVAPSSGGNDTSSPSSFAEVSWADASPAAAPSTQTTTPADAAVPPTVSGDTPGQERSPFIPRDRFDQVNTDRNALKEWKEQHAWAETVDRKAIAEAQRIGQLFSQDRSGFIREVLADAVKDPSLAPLVRSEAARLLGMRQQPVAAPPPTTLPSFELNDGTVVDLNALKEQWRQEARDEFAPAMQTAEQFQQAVQHHERLQQADGFSKSLYHGELKSLPGFVEHQPEMLKLLATTRLETDHPAEVRAAMLSIYNRVVIPKLLAGRDSKVLENLQQKAHAATSVNPGSAGASSPRQIRSFNDLGPDAWR